MAYHKRTWLWAVYLAGLTFVARLPLRLVEDATHSWINKSIGELWPPFGAAAFTDWVLWIFAAVVSVVVLWFAYRHGKAASKEGHEKSNVVTNKHDVPLRDAVYYFVTGKWDTVDKVRSGEVKVDDSMAGKLGAASDKLKQLASDGDLPMWGVRVVSSDSLQVAIKDTGYWEQHWPEWWYLVSDLNLDYQAVTLDELFGDGFLFHNLTTSKAVAERLWQSGNT